MSLKSSEIRHRACRSKMRRRQARKTCRQVSRRVLKRRRQRRRRIRQEGTSNDLLSASRHGSSGILPDVRAPFYAPSAKRTSEGTIFCQSIRSHDVREPYSCIRTANPYLQTAPAPPPIPPSAVRTSPGLAFLLGLIPGVGAIYNGQYLKGLLHVAVFGLLISAIDRSGGPQPLFGMMTAGFYFYMAFEAYHSAKKRQMGLAVDEWSSIIPRNTLSGRFPVGPILLIVLGVLFLLDELNWVRFYDVVRFWPLILIALGTYLLYSRISVHASSSVPPMAYPPVPSSAYPPPAYPPTYQTTADVPQGHVAQDVTQVEVQREQ